MSSTIWELWGMEAQITFYFWRTRVVIHFVMYLYVFVCVFQAKYWVNNQTETPLMIFFDFPNSLHVNLAFWYRLGNYRLKYSWKEHTVLLQFLIFISETSNCICFSNHFRSPTDFLNRWLVHLILSKFYLYRYSRETSIWLPWMPWMWISSNNIWPFRFSSVDAGNIVRLLAPDIGLLFSSIFILRLCIKLLRPVPQVNLHENGIPAADPEVDVKTHQWFATLPSECTVVQIWLSQQEAETSDTDSEDSSDSEGSSFDSSDETTVPVQSGPPQFVQKLIVFAAGLKVLLSAIMNTAGKVVVTLLLGLAGMTPADASLHHNISVMFCPLH